MKGELAAKQGRWEQKAGEGRKMKVTDGLWAVLTVFDTLKTFRPGHKTNDWLVRRWRPAGDYVHHRSSRNPQLPP